MNITPSMLNHIKVIRLQHAAEARVKALEAENAALKDMVDELVGRQYAAMMYGICTYCDAFESHTTTCPIARARALLEAKL